MELTGQEKGGISGGTGPCIYFISIDLPTGELSPIKIGYADDVAKRIANHQTSCPWPIKLLLAIPGTLTDELGYHARFVDSHLRGEWFHPTPNLLQYIKDQKQNPGVNLGTVCAALRLPPRTLKPLASSTGVTPSLPSLKAIAAAADEAPVGMWDFLHNHPQNICEHVARMLRAAYALDGLVPHPVQEGKE